MERIDYHALKSLTREVIRRRGSDFVYNPWGSPYYCAYVPFDEAVNAVDENMTLDIDSFATGASVTGCIIGEVIKEAGLMNKEIAASLNKASFLQDVWQDAEVGYLADRLQNAQDRGKSWGEAFKQAFDEEV